ncbi:MAG: tyrosine-type recombinase/integrase [Acidobacteria bacterium]|nr:tyrosine-type recombinase/integrase [Acidobacteriota bacterium]
MNQWLVHSAMRRRWRSVRFTRIWIFSSQTEIGTPTLDGNLDKRNFKKIIKAGNETITKANIENGEDRPLLKTIRLYDLRHTCATLLLSKGVNPKVVSERLGHSSIALTLDIYSHVRPDMQNEATGIMENLMFGTK